VRRAEASAGRVRSLPALGRCRVMGILNVTPDSFSDGGAHHEPDAAVARGRQMLAEGADLVDVGGESTRPGAPRVDADEELRRVLPVIRALAAEGATVSVDTTRVEVAEQALHAGAVMVNDVSGGLADPRMSRLVAESGVPYVVMHWRGPPAVMQEHATYRDVVAEVADALAERLARVTANGVDPEQVVLDPGLGFAKTAEHNWALLAGLPVLLDLGRPVLLGASRKSFLGRLLTDEAGRPRPAQGRDPATTAVSALAAAAGVWGVRVHDVQGSADAVRVAAAWADARRVSP
jgi:dihydropteroate synthase